MVASTAVESAPVSEPLDFESVVFVESEVVVDDDWLVPLSVVPLVFAVVPESALLGSLGGLALAALLESLFGGGGLGALLAGAVLLLAAALLFAAELFSGGGGGPASLLFALLFCGGGAGGCAAAESFGVF